MRPRSSKPVHRDSNHAFGSYWWKISHDLSRSTKRTTSNYQLKSVSKQKKKDNREEMSKLSRKRSRK